MVAKRIVMIEDEVEKKVQGVEKRTINGLKAIFVRIEDIELRKAIWSAVVGSFYVGAQRRTRCGFSDELEKLYPE